MAHRKPATGTLIRGRSEVVLEFGNIGHGEARAVDHPHAMTQPIGTLLGHRAEPGGHLFDQDLQDDQGQSHASLAVGRGAEGPPSEVNDMLTGGIAVEDLEQEERGGGDRIELAIAPGIAGLATGLTNGFRAENHADVLTQPSKDGANESVHGWASSGSG